MKHLVKLAPSRSTPYHKQTVFQPIDDGGQVLPSSPEEPKITKSSMQFKEADLQQLRAYCG
jgi:hypothetical protein